MGLDTTHEAWHGAYSAFMRWRQKICEVAGLPPLELMEGFYDPVNSGWCDPIQKEGFPWVRAALPIKWSALKPTPLFTLLNHSDCEGEIRWQDCKSLADALENLLPNFPDEDAGGHIGLWKDKTKQFIKGLRLAAKKKENLEFH